MVEGVAQRHAPLRVLGEQAQQNRIDLRGFCSDTSKRPDTLVSGHPISLCGEDIQDVIDNYTYIKQTHYNNKRLDKARKIQQEAQEKYGSKNITTLGHSKGAYYAEQLGQDSKDIITLNKPVHLSDVFKRVPMNQTDIKTTYDPVSVLRPYQKGNKPYIIESKTMNILKEHTTGVLDDMEVIFGS